MHQARKFSRKGMATMGMPPSQRNPEPLPLPWLHCPTPTPASPGWHPPYPRAPWPRAPCCLRGWGWPRDWDRGPAHCCPPHPGTHQRHHCPCRCQSAVEATAAGSWTHGDCEQTWTGQRGGGSHREQVRPNAHRSTAQHMPHPVWPQRRTALTHLGNAPLSPPLSPLVLSPSGCPAPSPASAHWPASPPWDCRGPVCT